MKTLLATSSLFYGSYAALWLLVFTLAVLVLLLYRHFGLAAMDTFEGVQRDGLGVGESAPFLTDGSYPSNGSSAGWDQDALLLFVTPGCDPCEDVIPYLSKLERLKTSIMVVVDGSKDIAAGMQSRFEAAFPFVADRDTQGFERYRVRATPFAFVIGQDGRVRSKGLCSDPWRLRDLLVSGGFDQAATLLEPSLQMAQRGHNESVVEAHDRR